jgi:hypothetical protein
VEGEGEGQVTGLHSDLVFVLFALEGMRERKEGRRKKGGERRKREERKNEGERKEGGRRERKEG